MKAMLVAVAGLQQLQELFLFSSAKMVPGCFCCLTGCWQEPPFWTLLIVVLLTAARPGSQIRPTAPARSRQPGGTGAAPAPGIRHLPRDRLRPGQDMGPVAGQGRVVGNGRRALLRCPWGRDWWLQGIMKWVPGPWAGWGGRGWQGPEGCFGFPAPALPCASATLRRSPAGSSTCRPWAWGWTHLPAPCRNCPWGVPSPSHTPET